MHEQKLKENSLGYIDPKQNRVITTHGFRSTFRDWSADKTDYSREMCEHVLAHKLPDEVEAAYLCGAYLEKKRKSLITDWAQFCCKLRLVFIENSHNKITRSTTTHASVFTENLLLI